MKHEDLAALVEDGYELATELPNGDVLVAKEMMFTTGLHVVKANYAHETRARGDSGVRTRFCYEHREDAIDALTQWDGQGDPPGPWVKQKPEDRLNPALANAKFDRYD